MFPCVDTERDTERAGEVDTERAGLETRRASERKNERERGREGAQDTKSAWDTASKGCEERSPEGPPDAKPHP